MANKTRLADKLLEDEYGEDYFKIRPWVDKKIMFACLKNQFIKSVQKSFYIDEKSVGYVFAEVVAHAGNHHIWSRNESILNGGRYEYYIETKIEQDQTILKDFADYCETTKMNL